MVTTSLIQPTILMVKQHNKTGLKYFHKTTRLDLIESYPGSGKHWKRHLNKHGNDLTNIWVSEVFHDKDLLEEFALFFSEFFDVVKSDEWANMQPENGLDGYVWSEEIAARQSQSVKKTQSDLDWKMKVGIPGHVKSVKNTDWDRVGKNVSKTMNDPSWKETVGKERSALISVQSIEKWKDEKYRLKRAESYKSTVNNPEWKETVGLEKSKNMSVSIGKVKNNPEWKKQNYVICEICKNTIDPGNYKRWHGPKCKHK